MDRRGFLSGLLKAGAVAPVAAVGMDIAKPSTDHAAFNFTCSCGNGLVAKVPEEVGQSVTLDCNGCGLLWSLEWTGGSFKTKMMNPREELRLDASHEETVSSVREGVMEAARELRKS